MHWCLSTLVQLWWGIIGLFCIYPHSASPCRILLCFLCCLFSLLYFYHCSDSNIGLVVVSLNTHTHEPKVKSCKLMIAGYLLFLITSDTCTHEVISGLWDFDLWFCPMVKFHLVREFTNVGTLTLKISQD